MNGLEHGARDVLRDVNCGRFERSVAGVTAASALLVYAGAYQGHDKGQQEGGAGR